MRLSYQRRPTNHEERRYLDPRIYYTNNARDQRGTIFWPECFWYYCVYLHKHLYMRYWFNVSNTIPSMQKALGNQFPQHPFKYFHDTGGNLFLFLYSRGLTTSILREAYVSVGDVLYSVHRKTKQTRIYQCTHLPGEFFITQLVWYWIMPLWYTHSEGIYVWL